MEGPKAGEKGLVNVELPKSIDNAVNNIADPVTKEVGGVLGDIIRLVFGGISDKRQKRDMAAQFELNKLQAKYESDLKEFERELEDKIAGISPENLIAPKYGEIGPILEKARYRVEDEAVRDMFTELIVSIMNQKHSNIAHPSYADIIQNMSPLDAQNFTIICLTNSVPILDIDCNAIQLGVLEALKCPLFLANADEPDTAKQATSINTLIRLGLITMNFDHQLGSDEYHYEDLREAYEKEFGPFFAHFEVSGFEKKLGLVRLTSFGRAFANVCVSDQAMNKVNSSYRYTDMFYYETGEPDSPSFR